eukprot:m.134626 g.134626  ORF g.134626 m.134626 type:complete len:189 (+) comp38152_c0_seq9:1241-1807(+)
MLHSQLHHRLCQIDVLDSVMKSCLLHDCSPARKCSHLLSSLYWFVAKFDALGIQDGNTDLLPCVFTLFLYTLRPYFLMLDSWLLQGTFVDTQNEFFISKQIDQSVGIKSSQYWKSAFTFSDEDIPVFMKDNHHNVVVCGKSVNLMMNVDKLRGVLRSKLPGAVRMVYVHVLCVYEVQSSSYLGAPRIF